MNDCNKSALTHRLTAVAAGYLDGMGFKPVETEVPVAQGWVADLASFTYPTRTEVRKLHMDKQLANWVDLEDADHVLQFVGPGPLTAIVEVKATKADFAKDRKRKFLRPMPPAHFCFLAYPRGIVEPDDIPYGWYGLETAAQGTKLLKVHRTRTWPHPQHPGQVADLIAQVAIRRDHRTRHKMIRDMQRAYARREGANKRAMKVGGIVKNIAIWLRGEGYQAEEATLSACLERWAGVKLPAYAQRHIEYLESLRQPQEASKK